MDDTKTTRHKISRKHLVNFFSQHRLHVFPLIALLIFIVFVTFRVSGTSIGIYYDYLYGSSSKDPSLIFGKPQGIRSDEWLVGTQLTIAQASDNFAVNNENYSEPKNLGIITDTPYAEWSVIFKPQNYMFFLLPVEFAFAFKWWFLFLVLIVGSYYFALKINKQKIILSILASIIISFSPFVFWWFQTATIAPLAYGFLIMLISMSIIDNKRLKLLSKKIRPLYSYIIKSLALAFVLVAFALVLYPPFQIPVAIVVAAFVLGYLINNRKGWAGKDWRRTIFTFLGAGVVAGSICGIFILTHSNEIHAITNTAYPGKRVVTSGGFDAKTLLVTYLQPQLQRASRGAHYIQNQSESANFIVLPLFFMIPAAAVIMWLYIKRRRIEWILVCLLGCSLIFLAHLFLPIPVELTKLFFLQLVPPSRLFIGLGLLGFIMMIYLITVLSKEIKLTRKLIIASTLYALIYTLVVVIAGFKVMALYPEFISSKLLIIGLALIPSLAFLLLLVGRHRLGLAILALFSLVSVVFIHPLYIGLGPIYKGEVSQRIDSLSKETDTWATAEDVFLENLPQMSDRDAITGVNPYPSLNFWKQFSNQEFIYNRYAHIILSSNDTSDLTLVHPDLFAVSLSCDRKIRQEIDFVLSVNPLTNACYQLIDQVVYPAKTFYFYKVSH